MTELQYTIELHSDAEPGTGRGGEVLNDTVPTDTEGRPTFPASHIKGLMREELRRLERHLNLGDVSGVLGNPAERDEQFEERRGDGGQESVCRVTDARAAASVATCTVTRTALDEYSGTVKEMSLRTTERIPAGTRFAGRLYIDAAEDSREDLAARLSLLSVRAVGGGRTRGSGRCVITIDGDTRSPGDLLRRLEKAEPTARSPRSVQDVPADSGRGVTVLRLEFRASGPICCPENPVRTGVIRSGFAIPTSAVQGAVLTRLNSISPDLASNVFKSDHFRAWPLLPCGFPDDNEELPYPVHVSLTHRVAKLAVDGKSLTEEEVRDQAIEPYDWMTVAASNPLKASDGVLLRYADESVQLWKAGSMPRILSAHGVHHDPQTGERNLYQTESMAPLVFSGTICLSDAAADVLLKSLETDPVVHFGRNRSIRGGGTLTACVVEQDTALPWISEGLPSVLIVQSPVRLPDRPAAFGTPVSEELKELIRTSWSDVPLPEIEQCWAGAGIRFGWNRHGHGMMTGKGNRLQARRVILPGSVVKFQKPLDPDTLRNLLIRGLGGDRDRGYGAVSVHPGKASSLFQKRVQVKELPASQEKSAVEAAIKLWNDSGNTLSPSQISAVEQRLVAGGKEAARDYINRQLKRTERIWSDWKYLKDDVLALIENHSAEHAGVALRMWADLVIANRKNHETNR